MIFNLAEKALAALLQASITLSVGFFYSGEVLNSVAFYSALFMSISSLMRNGVDVYLTKISDWKNPAFFFVFSNILALSFFSFLYAPAWVFLFFFISGMMYTLIEYRKSRGFLAFYFITPAILTLFSIFIFGGLVIPVEKKLGYVPYLIYIASFVFFLPFSKIIRENLYAVVSLLYFWKEYIAMSTFNIVPESEVGLIFLLIKLASLPSNILAVFDAKSLSFAVRKDGEAFKSMRKFNNKIFWLACFFSFPVLFVPEIPGSINSIIPIIDKYYAGFIFLYGCNLLALGIGAVTFPVIVYRPLVYLVIVVSMIFMYCVGVVVIPSDVGYFLSLSGVVLVFLKITSWYFCKTINKSYL